MGVNKAVEKYVHAIRSDTFANYEKEFARRINSALSNGYLQKLREDQLVQYIENVIKELNNLSMKDRKTYFELSTRSIFIHGPKSQVEFSYYGKRSQRELGDLIFIISLVLNERKYFEKLTINQFKKDSQHSGKARWDLRNKEQLYLLSRFPAFHGISGIIPKREFNLPNYSGCLGSYGFLYEPGDLAFTSATRLDVFSGFKNSLKNDDLFDMAYTVQEHFLRYPFECYFPLNLFDNYHYAHNTFDFAHKYLTMGIGEPIFMKWGIANSQARNFLLELLSELRSKAQGQGPKDRVNFVNDFFRYDYEVDEGNNDTNEHRELDLEGGGIGIIHTVINLGE